MDENYIENLKMWLKNGIWNRESKIKKIIKNRGTKVTIKPK